MSPPSFTSRVTAHSLTGASCVLILLYAGRAVLAPLALAAILSLVAAPLVRFLRRAGLPHWPATLATLLFAAGCVAGATGVDFERLMRNFGEYPSRFAPQVVSAKVLSQHGDQYQVMMRVRQKHVITVVMDTAYEVTFGRVDARRGFSTSRSTRVTEIADAGTPQERALAPDEEHGFLWRQNTYWSYEERDGGLYMQIESVSLSRGIPRGLGWVIGPYVQSVPRESLEFTLGRVKEALRGKKSG